MAIHYDFGGSTAIVTGGANGIGRAIAQRLAASGARVWIFDIAPAKVDGVTALSVDVTNSVQVATAIARVVEHDSKIDILINDAGLLGKYAPFIGLDPAEFRRVIEVNLIGALEVSHQVVPHMQHARRGRIVNMGSLAGKEGLPGMAAYSAASAGVIAFTKALAKEVAGDGIRVNCVAAGPIATDLISRLGQSVVDAMIERSPLKRLGTVDEVAELVAWLCSDACSFSTGAVFDMSGGRATY